MGGSSPTEPSPATGAAGDGNRDGDWDITKGVGYTALAVAAARAVESTRPAPLVTDPYAGVFLAAAQRDGTSLSLPSEWPPHVPEMAAATGLPPRELRGLWEGLADYLAVRSRYFDRALRSACHEAGIRQVVVLAAGLDARAHRLDWPDGVRCYEIDHPNVLAFKDSILSENDAKPGCSRSTVGCDLRDDWPTALREAGFDPRRPTAWLAEGLLFYLPDEAERLLCERVHELSAPGSRWEIESLTDPRAAVTRLTNDTVLRRLAEWMGIDTAAMCPGEQQWGPCPWLVTHDWTVTAISAHTLAASHGRALEGPGPVGDRDHPTVLLSAEYQGSAAAG